MDENKVNEIARWAMNTLFGLRVHAEPTVKFDISTGLDGEVVVLRVSTKGDKFDPKTLLGVIAFDEEYNMVNADLIPIPQSKTLVPAWITLMYFVALSERPFSTVKMDFKTSNPSNVLTMVTHQNAFVRKFGDLAIIITVTDWKQFEDLMQHATKDEEGNTHTSPDFLLGSSLMKTIYSNMLPAITFNTHDVEDITEDTKGMGLAAIMTGNYGRGPIWSYRTVRDPLLGGLISEQKDIDINE